MLSTQEPTPTPQGSKKKWGIIVAAVLVAAGLSYWVNQTSLFQGLIKPSTGLTIDTSNVVSVSEGGSYLNLTSKEVEAEQSVVFNTSAKVDAVTTFEITGNNNAKLEVVPSATTASANLSASEYGKAAVQNSYPLSSPPIKGDDLIYDQSGHSDSGDVYAQSGTPKKDGSLNYTFKVKDYNDIEDKVYLNFDDGYGTFFYKDPEKGGQWFQASNPNDWTQLGGNWTISVVGFKEGSNRITFRHNTCSKFKYSAGNKVGCFEWDKKDTKIDIVSRPIGIKPVGDDDDDDSSGGIGGIRGGGSIEIGGIGGIVKPSDDDDDDSSGSFSVNPGGFGGFEGFEGGVFKFCPDSDGIRIDAATELYNDWYAAEKTVLKAKAIAKEYNDLFQEDNWFEAYPACKGNSDAPNVEFVVSEYEVANDSSVQVDAGFANIDNGALKPLPTHGTLDEGQLKATYTPAAGFIGTDRMITQKYASGKWYVNAITVTVTGEEEPENTDTYVRVEGGAKVKFYASQPGGKLKITVQEASKVAPEVFEFDIVAGEEPVTYTCPDFSALTKAASSASSSTLKNLVEEAAANKCKVSSKTLSTKVNQDLEVVNTTVNQIKNAYVKEYAFDKSTGTYKAGTLPLVDTLVIESGSSLVAPTPGSVNTLSVFTVDVQAAEEPAGDDDDDDDDDSTQEDLPSLSVDNITFAEADTTLDANFVVKLSKASDKDVTFVANTEEGSADEDDDFISLVNKKFTIPAGDTSVKVTVKVIGDTREEDNAEDFELILSDPQNATIADGRAVATIVDNDGSDDDDDDGRVQRNTGNTEIKTGKVYVDDILALDEFSKLRKVNPVDFVDTEDHAVITLASLAYKGNAITIGYLNNGKRYFEEDKLISREEVVKMIMVAAASDYGKNTQVFPDVPDSRWSADFVNTAYKNGLVQGYGDGTFRPDRKVTRMEAIKILNEIAGLDRADSYEDNPYTDIDEDHWGYELAIDAYQSGIAVGSVKDGKRYIEPNEYITRLEMATIIHNYYAAKVARANQ